MQPATANAPSGGDSDGSCCYLCNQCASSFATLEELETHLSTHATEEVTSTTEHSPSSSDGSFPYEEGATKSHSPSGTPAESLLDAMDTADQEEYEADLNTSEVRDEPDMAVAGGKAHGHIHKGKAGKVFPCRFCAKLFHSRSLLNIHYTHTHRDKPQYECEDCGRIFSVKRELATHRRTHSGEQTHACAQCGKEFGTRQLLKKHWMWHTGQRSHVCPHCGKAFFQKGHLTQHLMIHAGGRPHVCNLCNKTFIFKFDLNRHMKIHAERGYTCKKCGQAFLKQSQYLDHDATCTASPKERKTPSKKPKKETAPTPQHQEDSFLTPQSTPDLKPPELTPASSLSGLTPAVSAAGGAPQRFFCLLCMQEYPSQAAYSLHFSYVHLRDAAAQLQSQQNTPNPTTAASSIFPLPQSVGAVFQSPADSSALSSLLAASSRASNGSGPLGLLTTSTPSANRLQLSALPIETSPNPSGQESTVDANDLGFHGERTEERKDESPSQSPPDQSEGSSDRAEENASGDLSSSFSTELQADGAKCESCGLSRHHLSVAINRVSDLEKSVDVKNAEIQRLRQKMRQVGMAAGCLLESCSEFDKLWMLHSKKVYSQIQSVLNSLE